MGRWNQNSVAPIVAEKNLGAVTLLIGARDAAKALAISERTLWGLTNGGGLPHVRIGRRVLYDPRDLKAWIDQQKKSHKKSAEYT